MTEYEYAISVQDVGKRYDRFALEHISFTVPKGSIMGFIGQNGAGKTTTIRSMLHITSIDQGGDPAAGHGSHPAGTSHQTAAGSGV